jgi:hypothetical protein
MPPLLCDGSPGLLDAACATSSSTEIQTIPITLAATASNGVPVAGAGNLETPGAEDVYTFFGDKRADGLSPGLWQFVDQPSL